MKGFMKFYYNHMNFFCKNITGNVSILAKFGVLVTYIINYVIVNFYMSKKAQTYMHLSFLFKLEKLLPEGGFLFTASIRPE